MRSSAGPVVSRGKPRQRTTGGNRGRDLSDARGPSRAQKKCRALAALTRAIVSRSFCTLSASAIVGKGWPDAALRRGRQGHGPPPSHFGTTRSERADAAAHPNASPRPRRPARVAGQQNRCLVRCGAMARARGYRRVTCPEGPRARRATIAGGCIGRKAAGPPERPSGMAGRQSAPASPVPLRTGSGGCRRIPGGNAPCLAADGLQRRTSRITPVAIAARKYRPSSST